MYNLEGIPIGGCRITDWPLQAMIISHQHKFIFLHCRKVAGSSCTVALNRHLGPMDVQIGAWDDTLLSGGRLNSWAKKVLLRSAMHLARKSASYSIKERVLALSPQAVNSIIKKETLMLHGGREAHVSAAHLSNVEQKIWDSYTKFCFVRNPWDHAVSDYFYRKNICSAFDVTFKEFLLRLSDPDRPDPDGIISHYRSNWQIYTIEDRISVDYVGRYENLEGDLSEIGRRIGINIKMPEGSGAKSAHRDKKMRLLDMYDQEGLDLVAQVYAKEICTFGYAPVLE